MPSGRQGSIHLFRLAGVDLYLHWSWFLVAAYEIQARRGGYSSVLWNVLEYLALFLIVLTHEFGHAMACRSVGGQANQILLWPLGGVAYVNPPQRPGAMLWSIAAGPLVNVALAPVLYVAMLLVSPEAADGSPSDLYLFLQAVFWINRGLLIFNMLPIYPLDGGQILRSLLWFVLGRGRSLMVATIIGFVGAAGMIVIAVVGFVFGQGGGNSIWIGALCVFMLLNCWNGLKSARAMLRLAKLPRREGFACPSCRTAPPLGAFWRCGSCQQPFDLFETRGVCPQCSARFETVMCLDCREQRPLDEWTVGARPEMGVVSGSFETK
jgi:Zn-dependent protease